MEHKHKVILAVVIVLVVLWLVGAFASLGLKSPVA
jgi:hypothetical protein